MKYIDLFSGAGGLSLGIKTAGFELTFAIEKSPMAGETFYHNLISPLTNLKEDWNSYLNKTSEEKFKNGLYIGSTGDLLEDSDLLSKVQKSVGTIDLIAGGPPCQGFSMAGKRDPNDIRNLLPLQFLEYVSIFSPKAVLMENVVGINQCFLKGDCEEPPLAQIKRLLENKNKSNGNFEYIVQELKLDAIHYGVPQHRNRIFLLGIRKDIADLKKLTVTKDIYDSISYYENEPYPDLFPIPTSSFSNNFPIKFEDGQTVDKAIGDLYLNGTSKSNYVNYLNEKSGFKDIVRDSYKPMLNHNQRNHSEKVANRFRLYQIFINYGISKKVFNIASKFNDTKESSLYDDILLIIKDIDFPVVSNDNIKMADSAKELVSLILELATKKHSQKPLRGDLPSPTVMSIPDDVIHPLYPRTMTVREQARFQSFPDYFEFRSKETTGGKARKTEVPQYTQVGNAVPPLLAKAIAEHIFKLIK